MKEKNVTLLEKSALAKVKGGTRVTEFGRCANNIWCQGGMRASIREQLEIQKNN